MTDEGDTWSKGSLLHSEGKCRPCHYIRTSLGCLTGRECEYCHLAHTRKSRPRPCKTKRMQCNRIVSMLEDVADKDTEQFAAVVQDLSTQSSYLRGLIRKRLKQKTGIQEEEEGEESGRPDGSEALSSAVARARGSGPDAGDPRAKSLLSL